MIAIPLTGQRWLFLLLVSAVAMTAWRAWPAAPVAEAEDAPADVHSDVRPVTYRYVPLIGLPLDNAVDAADGDWENPPLEAPIGPVNTCLPFLAPILQHPSWQLRITDVVSHCTGDDILGDFTIASTGEVTWTKPGWPVRRLALSSEQLALVRRLDQLSCVQLQTERRGGYSVEWLSIGLDLGQHDPYTGARIMPASMLGRAVTAMLDELTAEYRRPRREAIGSIDLRLATTEPGAVYRVRIAGERLTVKRGRKLLVDEPVDAELLVDLVDTILERRAVAAPDLKGVLLMRGGSVPVTVEDGRGPFEPIYRAIRNAQYWEEQARESRME
jgi:hypothetical protein